jgi:hypothetical protein
MRTIVVSVALGIILVPLPAAAVTRTVSSTGIDSPTCGSSASPCRSITRALQNATAGDRIVVRPGLYSDDLDGDGVFGEPGEEPGLIGIGLEAVTVESTGGAAATVIRRRGTVPSSSAVSVSGTNAKFGKLNKGFTVITQGGANSTNVSVTAPSGAEVVGNVIAGTINIGFGATGTGALLKDNRVVCPSTSGGIGFLVLLGDGIRLERNAALGCGLGFTVAGPGHVLTRNLAVGGGVGFNLGDFAELSRNAALGSSNAGVTLNSGSTPGLILANSFAGNGAALGLNCGIQNNTGTAVTAAGNFWGTATGPGADPADQACNTAGSTIVTTPFSTTDLTPTMAALR